MEVTRFESDAIESAAVAVAATWFSSATSALSCLSSAVLSRRPSSASLLVAVLMELFGEVSIATTSGSDFGLGSCWSSLDSIWSICILFSKSESCSFLAFDDSSGWSSSAALAWSANACTGLVAESAAALCCRCRCLAPWWCRWWW